MIALNSECVLVEYPSGELRPCFPEDITPEMLEMERVDPDYFRGAVEAVFTYVNRGNYLGRLRLGELAQIGFIGIDLCSPAKLISACWTWRELIRQNSNMASWLSSRS
jgi:hypothetical protein